MPADQPLARGAAITADQPTDLPTEQRADPPADQPADTAVIVLERLLAAHETWFDVSEHHAFGGRVFAGYAEFHSSAEKYVLVKRAKLWGVNSHEYLFFQLCPHLTASDIDDYFAFMTTRALEKVRPDEEHMVSYLSLVIISHEITEEARHAIRKARFRKNFQFGFKGWADLRLAAVDLGKRRVITNAMGKELRKTLEANAFL